MLHPLSSQHFFKLRHVMPVGDDRKRDATRIDQQAPLAAFFSDQSDSVHRFLRQWHLNRCAIGALSAPHNALQIVVFCQPRLTHYRISEKPARSHSIKRAWDLATTAKCSFGSAPLATCKQRVHIPSNPKRPSLGAHTGFPYMLCVSHVSKALKSTAQHTAKTRLTLFMTVSWPSLSPDCHS